MPRQQSSGALLWMLGNQESWNFLRFHQDGSVLASGHDLRKQDHLVAIAIGTGVCRAGDLLWS
jgi:hypothetical protein